MTEAEIIESVFIMGAGAVSCLAIYISVIFAYLAAAYFVGADLTRLQVFVISGLFVAAETVAGATCAAVVYAWEKLIAETASYLNSIPFFTLGILHKYMAVLLLSGILVGLYFMHDVRKKVQKDDNAAAT